MLESSSSSSTGRCLREAQALCDGSHGVRAGECLSLAKHVGVIEHTWLVRGSTSRRRPLGLSTLEEAAEEEVLGRAMRDTAAPGN